MNKLKINQIVLSISAFWAAINGELGLPLNRQLRFLDSLGLIWSVIIMCTTSVKFMAKDLSLNVTRGASYKKGNGPTLHDLLTINYLPRINEFEKLYYGLVCVSIGTSLCWRLYLRFCRLTPCGRANNRVHGTGSRQRPNYNDAKCSLVRFLYWGPPIVATRSPPSSPVSEGRSAASEVAHLEWVKLFECRTAIKDLADCSREVVRSLRQAGDPKEEVGEEEDDENYERRLSPLSRLHGTILKRRSCSKIIGNLRLQTGQSKILPGKDETDDIFLNPVRSYNFLKDYSWRRWTFIERNLAIILTFIIGNTIPILYYTITGLYSVMRNFSYETLDTKVKLLLHCYGIMEQVYACSQAALFFIFTNVFITIFHADIQFKINTIDRELREINRVFRRNDSATRQDSAAAATATATPSSTRPPKILIYYQQLRLWAFFDYINQIDDFVSRYSIVCMSTFMIGLSFGQSFLRVEEPALKRGTAAVMVANFLSFTFLYVISWDIERRFCIEQSSRLHGTLLSIASRDRDFLIKRLWLKTFFGFFERDCKRTFTLAGRYCLNLHSYFKTVFGWFTMSLLINRLFHRSSWENIAG